MLRDPQQAQSGERENRTIRAQLAFTFLMILRLAQVASPTRLAQPRSHTEWEDPKSQGITHSTDWNQHARRAGSMSRGWDPEGFLGSASPTSASGCPKAVPVTVPGGTPASPPTMEGVQLEEGTLGGASSVAFFWVGLAQCQVASQAIPHLKHPSVQDSLMKGHGVQALRGLSLLFNTIGEGWPWPHLKSLQLWLLRFNVQSLKNIEIVTRRNSLYTTLKLYSVSCSGLEMDFFNESGN